MSAGRRHARLARALGGFAADRRGLSAIEFAMLAPVFIVFMLTIIDNGVYYYVNSQFETAVFRAQEALNSAATRPTSAQGVKAIICAKAPMISCSKANFFVEVGPLTATQPQSSLPTGDSFSVSPNKPNMIRAVYPWTNILPVDVLAKFGVPISINTMSAGVFFYPTN